MDEVIDELEKISHDEKIIGLYDAEKIQQKIVNTMVLGAKLEGIKEGVKNGTAKGMEQRTIEIAKNMLKENIDISIITKVTGLSEEQVKKLDEK